MSFLKVYKQDILSSNRNFGLDLIRSIAILLVLIAHLGIEGDLTGGLKIGGLGVEIFFVLSGFLIGQIIIKQMSIELSFRSIKDFWIRRWFRTLPLYYLIILIKFIFVDHSLGYKIIVYFLFLQNNFVGIDFMPVTWSLVIEEWFYLTLPVLLFLFFHKKLIQPKKLLVFIIGFICFITFSRFCFVFFLQRGYDGVAGNFPFRLDSLMCGVLLAHIKLNFKALYLKLASFKLFLIALISYAVLLIFFGWNNLVPGKINTLLWTRTHWFLLNSLAIAFLIPFIEEKVVIRSQKSVLKIIVTCISVFSYCVYLIHVEVYHYLVQSPVLTKSWAFESVFSLVLIFLVSAFFYGIYEKPMTNLRERFRSKA